MHKVGMSTKLTPPPFPLQALAMLDFNPSSEDNIKAGMSTILNAIIHVKFLMVFNVKVINQNFSWFLAGW